jgi:hypothetical protein
VTGSAPAIASIVRDAINSPRPPHLPSRPFVLHSSPDPKDKIHLPPPLYPGVHGHGVVLGALAKLNPMAAGERVVVFYFPAFLLRAEREG